MLRWCWKKKIVENDQSLILSVSCYVLIKDQFTNKLSDEQIKRNRNKALSKLLALSSA